MYSIVCVMEHNYAPYSPLGGDFSWIAATNHSNYSSAWLAIVAPRSGVPLIATESA